MKKLFYLSFVFVSFVSFSYIEKSFFISQGESTQDDSLFSDSDLADIEGFSSDTEDGFEDEVVDNFDENYYEVIEDEEDDVQEEEGEDSGGGNLQNQEDKEFDEDYELIEDEEKLSDYIEDEQEEGDLQADEDEEFDYEDYELIEDEEELSDYIEDEQEEGDLQADEDEEFDYEDYELIEDEEELSDYIEDEQEEGDLQADEDEEFDYEDYELLEDEDFAEEELIEDEDFVEDYREESDTEGEFIDEMKMEDSLDSKPDFVEEDEGSALDTEKSMDKRDEDAPLDVEKKSGDLTLDSPLNQIINIRYVSSTDQIVIDCTEPTSYQVRTNEKTNQFIIEILQAKLADNLQWPYILRDFKTNFGLIKADQKDSTRVRIVIQLKEGVGFPTAELTEDSDQIVVSYPYASNITENTMNQMDSNSLDSKNILPSKTLEDLYLSDIEYSGSPISFHVIDAPIKQVLRFISEESNLNMVIGESVQGTVTLKLEDVPWDQALHTIFKVKSLGYTRDGNVITVLPLQEIEERTKKIQEILDRQKKIIPYVTEVISINYGEAKEIEDKIKDFITKETQGSAGETIPGGQIIVNDETNTLIIIDTPEVVDKITQTIKYMDKSPKQVIVEAKIVEASKNFSNNFGLNWNLSADLPLVIGGDGFLDIVRGQGSNSGLVNLTVSGLPIIGNLTASLNIAESNGYAEIISTPKVVVLSGEAGSFNRNSPILIPSSTTTSPSVGATTQTTETTDVSIGLEVTPTVTNSGSIFLKVNVTRSDAGGPGDALKVTREADTKVLVKNGQTIVLAGIYEKEEVKTNDTIPFISYIPFLNLLVNNLTKSFSTAELLIFVTPRIIDIDDE